jgi:hypothetical protein
MMALLRDSLLFVLGKFLLIIQDELLTGYRKARSVVIRKLSGFTSVGHFIVFVGFIAMNIGLSTFSIDWSNLTAISKRTGW